MRVNGGKLGGLEMEGWHRGSVAEAPCCASSAAPQRVRLWRGRQVTVVLHHLLRRVLLCIRVGAAPPSDSFISLLSFFAAQGAAGVLGCGLALVHDTLLPTS